MSTSTANVHEATAAWKKTSLAQLHQLRNFVRQYTKDLYKLCASVKTVDKDIDRGASQLASRFDKSLDEESDNYEKDSDTMAALQEIPSAEEAAEDVKVQASDVLEALLSQLDDTIQFIQAIKP